MTVQKKKSSSSAGSKTKKKSSAKKRITTAERNRIEKKNRLRDEIWSIALIAVGLFLVVSLQTGATGELGVVISNLLKGLFGIAAYILPYYLMGYGVLLFLKLTGHLGAKSVICLLLIFIMLSMLVSAWYLHRMDDQTFTLSYIAQAYQAGKELSGGGVFGMCIGLFFVKLIGLYGLCILAAVTMFICILLVVNTPVSQFFDSWKEHRSERKAKEAEEELMLAQYREEEEAEREASKRGRPSGSKPIVTGLAKEEMQMKRSAAKGKKNILTYMQDDQLFESSQQENDRMGLEEVCVPEPGKGYTEVGHFISASSLESAAVQEEILFPADLFEPEPIAAEQKKSAPAEEERLSDSTAGTGLPCAEAVPTEQPMSKEQTVSSSENGSKDKAAAPEKAEELTVVIGGVSSKPYQFPPIDLLKKATLGNHRGEEASLQAKAAKLEETLHNFGVNAKVLQVTKGPAVTRYEIQPSTGVKVNSIVRLSDDIALNLEAKSIRMEAPIPGKAAVGIEVENDKINMVTLREIVDSDPFRKAKSKITFAVGKDISGNPIVADLKSMPHLLIAGSTGSGKSVCINSIIISMLYKAKPEEVKFVLIDPKVVELSNYNGIPHMLIPVVTDPSKAAAALNWAVAEMTDRYKKFAEAGVRDLESFNDSVKANNQFDRFMPQVVIIIDELADLMMAAPSQVEESICRLAQMARAAGMHLIVATQRPSVDVITGVIKANIPSRIAFAVSSQVDSRTILDMGGAEKLVGKGDMLFNPLGMSKPLRVQGAFLSDGEVHSVLQCVKDSSPQAEYASDVLHTIDRVQADVKEEDEDDLLPDAIETVVRAEQASVSMLQRRFRIGYNRAARLVDSLETRGIVGPAEGSRPRKVLMTLEELESLNRQETENEPVPDLID